MFIKNAIKSVIKAFFSVIPKNKYKIIFESNSDFCDNTRAVYEYMLKNNMNEKYKLVWCVSNPINFKENKTSNVTFTSFKNRKYFFQYMVHIATAKTVLYTHTPPALIDIKRQTVINLWHGTPLKALNGFVPTPDQFTFLVSPSELVSEILVKCFNIEKSQILLNGYPRNDQLFENIDSLAPLGIEKSNYTKIILWMPTFRKHAIDKYVETHETKTGLPLLETNEMLLELNRNLLKNNQFMIIKLHPGQDLSSIDMVSLSNIKMLTNSMLDEKEIGLYHLVNNADVLLTDYSSIYFDYLLLNRPIGFIIDDMNEYDNNRGFIVENPLEFMPGKHIKLHSELYDFLNEMVNNIDEYEEKRAKILSITNDYSDDKSCEYLLEKLGINKENYDG